MSEARLPRLYAIVDAGCLGDAAHVTAFARELAGAGVTILQYRNKGGDARGCWPMDANCGPPLVRTRE